MIIFVFWKYGENICCWTELSFTVLADSGNYLKNYQSYIFFSCWKAAEAKTSFPSKTRTKQGIWYLWETLRKVYFSTDVFIFSLKELLMFNSCIFLNCFHLVLSVLFLCVSGCWHGFSWVQRHSLCYTFCIQPFAVKTKLWERTNKAIPTKIFGRMVYQSLWQENILWTYFFNFSFEEIANWILA